MGSYQWQPRSDFLKCRELSLNSVMGESIQPVPWSHSVLPEFWTCEEKNSIKGVLSVFCMIRAVSWWSCLTFLYSYQALYQMSLVHTLNICLIFLHGRASSFSNVCVLLTKAVGFIFKSLPLHFFACLILLNTHDRGTYGIVLDFLQIASLLLSFHYMQFKENALLCCWIVLLQYVILCYSQVLPSTML